MEPRIIKTNDQYRHFRAEVEELALLDPDPESPEGLRLELLAKLVEDYEKTGADNIADASHILSMTLEDYSHGL